MIIDRLLTTWAIFVRASLFHHAMHLDQWRTHVARSTEMQFRLLSHGTWRAVSHVRKTCHPYTRHSVCSSKQSFPSSNEGNSRKYPEGWCTNKGGHFGKRGEIRKKFRHVKCVHTWIDQIALWSASELGYSAQGRGYPYVSRRKSIPRMSTPSLDHDTFVQQLCPQKYNARPLFFLSCMIR